MTAIQLAVALVALQRLAELLFARRNTRRLLADTGKEYGAGHYPLIVVLHVGWLAALLLFVSSDEPVRWWAAGLYLALQPLRLWIIASLGRRWTTRIIVVPGAPPIRTGPYRWLRHPNYSLVAAEIALLPLAFGAWEVALAFSVANLPLIAWRVRVEEAALAEAAGHANVYGVRASFRPESGR